MSDSPKHYHAEIAYGQRGSDLCSETKDQEYRELLHKALDEFLDNYNPHDDPDSYFIVGNPCDGPDNFFIVGNPSATEG